MRIVQHEISRLLTYAKGICLNKLIGQKFIRAW
jgi:hypothetical protein